MTQFYERVANPIGIMCKSPLFAYQFIPKCEDLEGEFILDPCMRFDKRLHFLHCDRTKFDLLKSECTDPSVCYLEVGCGQCMECRIKKSRQWAQRIVCEQMCSDTSSFITLTYDDDHLPLGRGIVPSLDKEVIPQFMKKLRRYCDYHFGFDGLRYYCAGEYGSSTSRPHYHLCVFNLPQKLLDSSYPYKRSFNGDIYYNNDEISKIWNKGHVVLGELNFQSAAYVARYVTKKLNGDSAELYDRVGIQPEFALMSRKPGIGSEYYNRFKDHIYEFDSISLPHVGAMSPNSYFDKKFALDEPEVMEYIKGLRQLSAERSMQYQLSQTDLDYESYLKVKSESFENRIKHLVRPLE